MRIYFKHILLLCLFISTSIFGQGMRLLHEKSFDVSSGQLLEVESDVGDFKIRTWDKNEVYIKVYGDNDAEEDVRFHFEETADGVLIDAESNDGGWSWFDNIRVRYEIDVPQNFDIDLSTSGGDVILGDLTGEIELRTSGGDIYTTNTKGNLRARTSGGDIETKDVEGDVSISTSGGDIIVHASDGSLSAKTSGGDIEAEYLGENYGIELSTSGGDITAYIPDNFKSDVYLKTSGGDIDVDLEARIREMSDDRFEGQMNGGGKEVNCRTSGGDIILKAL